MSRSRQDQEGDFLAAPASARISHFDQAARSYSQQALLCSTAAVGVSKANIQPNDSVLDLGCGTGVAILEAKRRQAGQVIGIDFSRESLRIAQQQLDQDGLSNGVQLIVQDLDGITAAALTQQITNPPVNGFDHVFVMNVFLKRATELALLDTAVQMLKPGGKLTIVRTYRPAVISHVNVAPASGADPSVALGVTYTVLPSASLAAAAQQLRTFCQRIAGTTLLHLDYLVHGSIILDSGPLILDVSANALAELGGTGNLLDLLRDPENETKVVQLCGRLALARFGSVFQTSVLATNVALLSAFAVLQK